MKTGPLSPELLHRMDAYWRAANHLSVGQMYRCDVAKQNDERRKTASLNYLLASHVWRQGHNGFTHQDPGFIDHVVNKKAEVVRVYLPPDANCLLSVMDHPLRSRHYVNVVVAGKMDTIARLPRTGDKGIYLKRQLKDTVVEHKQYIDKNGRDMPEIRDWRWGNPS